MKNIFSFDAETDGLWGYPFAIAATVTSPDGVEVAKFEARVSEVTSPITTQWVVENVLPHIQDMPIVRSGALLSDFAEFYLAHKTDAVVIAHCPNPVEARVIEMMHSGGFIGDWDAPFPLIGVEGLLDMAGENPTEATAYATAKGLTLPDGNPHNPLYDCRLATTMYRHLKGW